MHALDGTHKHLLKCGTASVIPVKKRKMLVDVVRPGCRVEWPARRISTQIFSFETVGSPLTTVKT